MFRVTLLAVLVKYKKKKKIVHLYKNKSIYLVLAYKQYHYKCSVHVLYISAPQVKA